MRLSRRPAGNERGAALILVLWVSAAAAVLAMGFLDWARADASLNRNAEAAIQARLASEGALAAAAYEMASGKLALERGRAELTVRLDGVEVQVTVRGELGLIDLNKARQDLLAGLAEATGVDRKAAALAAKAITAWRDVPKSKTQGQVVQPKLLGDRLASRRDHGFDHVNELRLVPGLDPAVVDKLAPWLTVYSGSDQVDADLAPATVKEAVSTAAGLRAVSGSSNAGAVGSAGGTTGQLSTLPSATSRDPVGHRSRRERRRYRLDSRRPERASHSPRATDRDRGRGRDGSASDRRHDGVGGGAPIRRDDWRARRRWPDQTAPRRGDQRPQEPLSPDARSAERGWTRHPPHGRHLAGRPRRSSLSDPRLVPARDRNKGDRLMAALLEDRRGRWPSPLGWWVAELQGLLPRRAVRRAGRSLAVILLDEGDLVRAAVWRRGRVAPIGSFDPSLVALRGPESDPVLQRIRRSRLPVVLRLPARSGLLCSDTLPASAEPELDQIMLHKIDVLTPWTAEQVYAAPSLERRRGDGSIAVRLAVVPRDVVDAACARLEALGVTVASVDLAGEAPWSAPEIDLLGGDAPGSRANRLGAALLLAFVIAASVGAAFAWSEIHARSATLADRRAFAAALEQRLADMPTLRQDIDRMRKAESFVAREIKGQSSAMVVLEVAS